MAAAMDADTLESDCQELRGMIEKAKRPNVRKELQRVLDMLEAELSRAKAGTASATAKSLAGYTPPSAPAATETTPKQEEAKKAAVLAEPAHVPVPVAVKSAGPWTEITTYSLDLGGYDKPNITVDLRLKGVEALETQNVTCDFTESSFDVKVLGLDGKNHRFFKTNLEKDIVPRDSSVKVKKNHVIVTLQKVKGEYGYDSWTDLLAKGKRKPTSKKDSSNPQDSIMDMMKDMYDDGDDNMKKIIGEAMYKSRRGEKMDPKEDFKSGLDDM
jgi:calcyclin binding protein